MQAVEEFVHCDEYGSPIYFHLESHHPIDTIKVKISSKIYGWVVEIGEQLKLQSRIDLKVSAHLTVHIIAKIEQSFSRHKIWQLCVCA